MLMDYLIKKDVSVYRASKDTGIPYSTLNEILIEKTDIKKVTADTLYRLSKYLGVSMETLYEGDSDAEKRIFILHNSGSMVIIRTGGREFKYQGPKNLIAFKRINKVYENVIYVDTYFRDSNGEIYCEEDFIDCYSLLKEFRCEELLNSEYEVIIGGGGNSAKIRLIDEALMVSDNFALCYEKSSTDDDWVKAINLSRRTYVLMYDLTNSRVLSSSMSIRMEKRALAAIERNRELLVDEVKERRAYA